MWRDGATASKCHFLFSDLTSGRACAVRTEGPTGNIDTADWQWSSLRFLQSFIMIMIMHMVRMKAPMWQARCIRNLEVECQSNLYLVTHFRLANVIGLMEPSDWMLQYGKTVWPVCVFIFVVTFRGFRGIYVLSSECTHTHLGYVCACLRMTGISNFAVCTCYLNVSLQYQWFTRQMMSRTRSWAYSNSQQSAVLIICL